MSRIKIFFDARDENIELGRNLMSCIRTLAFVQIIELGRSIVPRTFSEARGRVDAIVLESRVEAIHVAKAVISFLNTLLRFRHSLPSIYPRVSRSEQKKPFLIIADGQHLLLPATSAQQRVFFERVLSTRPRRPRKQQRSKRRLRKGA